MGGSGSCGGGITGELRDFLAQEASSVTMRTVAVRRPTGVKQR
jgi:hypothetical protein